MNRAEMRRQKKAESQNTKTRMMSIAEINKLKKAITAETTERAFSVLLGLSTYALRAEFDFTGAQLEAFIDRVMSAYSAFEDGKLSMTDIHAIVYKETGIVLQQPNGSDILPKIRNTEPSIHRENDDLVGMMEDIVTAHKLTVEMGTLHGMVTNGVITRDEALDILDD